MSISIAILCTKTAQLSQLEKNVDFTVAADTCMFRSFRRLSEKIQIIMRRINVRFSDTYTCTVLDTSLLSQSQRAIPCLCKNRHQLTGEIGHYFCLQSKSSQH